MNDSIVTPERLKELLSYNPETGLFIWIGSGKHKKGNIEGVGHLNKDGYVYTYLEGRRYLAHRLAWLYMTDEWPDIIDHDDRVRSNNKWSNLKSVSKSENGKNNKLNVRNTSGFTGVSFNKKSGLWRAKISNNGEVINLGAFKAKESAILKRQEANIIYGYHENHGV